MIVLRCILLLYAGVAELADALVLGTSTARCGGSSPLPGTREIGIAINMMKRVCIVGCPGVGKTAFAIKLAKLTGLPVVHLDYYYHQRKYNYYEDKQAWAKQVKKLMQQERWIIDGNYSSTLVERLKKADAVVFFDYPRWFALYRVLKRRLVYHFKKREEMPDEWKEKANLEFLFYVWSFNNRSKPKIIDAIKQSKVKNVIIFQTPEQAENYLHKVKFS